MEPYAVLLRSRLSKKNVFKNTPYTGSGHDRPPSENRRKAVKRFKLDLMAFLALVVGLGVVVTVVVQAAGSDNRAAESIATVQADMQQAVERSGLKR